MERNLLSDNGLRIVPNIDTNTTYIVAIRFDPESAGSAICWDCRKSQSRAEARICVSQEFLKVLKMESKCVGKVSEDLRCSVTLNQRIPNLANSNRVINLQFVH